MITIFSSAQRTATANSVEFTLDGKRGARFYLNITTATAGTLDMKIQSKCPLADTWIDVPGAVFAQKSAAGLDDLLVCPGITDTANESVADNLQNQVLKAVATMASSPDMVFSLSAIPLD